MNWKIDRSEENFQNLVWREEMGYVRFSVTEDDRKPHIFDLLVLKLFDLGTLYILKNY